jgi:hypothetical protein
VLLKEDGRVREHFSGAKVFDTIANRRLLGKPPANDELIWPTGVQRTDFSRALPGSERTRLKLVF